MKLFASLIILGSVAGSYKKQIGSSIEKAKGAGHQEHFPIMTESNDSEFPTVTIGSQTWSAKNISVSIDGAVCYEGNPDYCKIFGRLYTYAQALEVEKQFPGWRLPTKEDVDKLIEFLGGEEKAGKELKTGGSSHFNALLAGFREAADNQYYRVNKQTGFWTSTSENRETAWKFYLTIERDNVNFHPVYKKYGDSIRLIKIE